MSIVTVTLKHDLNDGPSILVDANNEVVEIPPGEEYDFLLVDDMDMKISKANR